MFFGWVIDPTRCLFISQQRGHFRRRVPQWRGMRLTTVGIMQGRCLLATTMLWLLLATLSAGVAAYDSHLTKRMLKTDDKLDGTSAHLQDTLIHNILPLKYDDIVTLLLEDRGDAALNYLYNQTIAIKTMLNTTEEVNEYLSIQHTTRSLVVNSKNATQVVREYVAEHTISLLEGGLPAFIKGQNGLLFVDPINLTTGVHQVNPEFIYMFPTFGQQCFAFAQYLRTHSQSDAHSHVIIREESGMNRDELMQAMNIALDYFHFAPATALVQTKGLITNSIPTEGTSFLVGLHAGDVAPLVNFLAAHEEVTVMINFDDLTILYEHLMVELGNQPELTQLRSRILFVTNLPRWTFPPPINSGVFSLFFQHTPSTYWTPAAMRSFFVEFFVDFASQITTALFPHFLQTQIYASRIIQIGPITFGPYGAQCAYPTNITFECLTNAGATKMSLWRYSSLFDEEEEPLLTDITPPERALYAGRSNDIQSKLFTVELLIMVIVLVVQIVGLTTLGILMATGRCGLWEEPATVLSVHLHRSRPESRRDRGALVWAMKTAMLNFSAEVDVMVKSCGAIEVESTRSGFDVATPDAVTALRLAVELQEHFASDAYRSLHPVLDLRMGLHTTFCDCAPSFEAGNVVEQMAPTAVIAKCISHQIATAGSIFVSGWTLRAARSEFRQRGWSTTNARIFHLDDLTDPIPVSEVRGFRPRRSSLSTDGMDTAHSLHEGSRSSTPQQRSSSASNLWKPSLSSGHSSSPLGAPSSAVLAHAPPLSISFVAESSDSSASPVASSSASPPHRWIAVPHPPTWDESAVELGGSRARGPIFSTNMSASFDPLFSDQGPLAGLPSFSAPRPIRCLSSMEVSSSGVPQEKDDARHTQKY